METEHVRRRSRRPIPRRGGRPRGGPAFYAYSTNYLIDVPAGIMVDVEATPASQADEVNATRTMIERVEERFDLKPERLIGDMAYGTAEILGWMVDEKQIEPHVPVWDKTQRNDETLSSSDFQWDEQADEYRCPQGQRAAQRNGGRSRRLRTHITKADTIIYRRQPIRLRELPDEGALLSEHTDSEDRSQRP